MPTESNTRQIEYLTLAEVSKQCRRIMGNRLARSTVYRWCLDGKLKSERIGSKIFVTSTSLNEFLEARPVCERRARNRDQRRGQRAADRIRGYQQTNKGHEKNSER